MVSTANSCEKKEQLLCSANSSENKAIVVGGATASGKSGLALTLAKELNGVVINADSMQVYRDVPTLTARPSESEQQGIPHRLYGFLEPDENCSVFKWVRLAAEEIKRAWRENKVPVVVGGTGFYLQTLIQGISPVPQVKDETRAEIRRQYERQGYDKFLKDFQKKDPFFTFTDPQRILRAAEVLAETGKSVTYWQSLPFQKEIEADFLCFLTDVPREELYERCNKRFKQMMKIGAVEEVQTLLAKNPPADCLIMKAVGVAEIKAMLSKEMSREQAVLHACQMTRNYAKRQMTWFKHRFFANQVVSDAKSRVILTKALHFLG